MEFQLNQWNFQSTFDFRTTKIQVLQISTIIWKEQDGNVAFFQGPGSCDKKVKVKRFLEDIRNATHNVSSFGSWSRDWQSLKVDRIEKTRIDNQMSAMCRSHEWNHQSLNPRVRWKLAIVTSTKFSGYWRRRYLCRLFVECQLVKTDKWKDAISVGMFKLLTFQQTVNESCPNYGRNIVDHCWPNFCWLGQSLDISKHFTKL